MNVFLALDFNVFSYIRPDEARLSNLMAELLSPVGNHGQGDAFLRVFIEQLGVNINWPASSPRVRREEPVTYPPKSYGFIDIVVDLGSYGIGIENKPWAGEQPSQLKRYLKHLKHSYPAGFCLVYLSGNGRPPETLATEQQNILKEAGRFRLLSYSSGLCTWLRACEKECKADKIRWLIRDFEAYLSARFIEEELEGETTNDSG